MAACVTLFIAPVLHRWPVCSGHMDPQVPAVYAEQRGADHYGIPALHGTVTDWFRLHLMADEQARGLYFGPGCAYCSSSFWSVFERNAKAQAVAGP
ncbi:hypothetical protein GCM10027184_67660 [Saccharothrix stipae]